MDSGWMILLHLQRFTARAYRERISCFAFAHSLHPMKMRSRNASILLVLALKQLVTQKIKTNFANVHVNKPIPLILVSKMIAIRHVMQLFINQAR